MGSLDQFSSKDFDPNDFINGLCESKPEDTSLDRYDCNEIPDIAIRAVWMHPQDDTVLLCMKISDGS